jgi:hypothetical protein
MHFYKKTLYFHKNKALLIVESRVPSQTSPSTLQKLIHSLPLLNKLPTPNN